MFGLSKERPILDHHAKAHILDFMKSGGFSYGFHEIQWISGEIQWILYGFQGEIRWISYGFHEIWQDFERPIARDGKP